MARRTSTRSLTRRQLLAGAAQLALLPLAAPAAAHLLPMNIYTGGAGSGGDPESVLFDASFASDAEGFSAGTQVAADGQDFADGYLEVAANETATKSFTPQTSGGAIRYDFWVYVADATTGSGIANFVYLLPTAGAVSSANSLAAFQLDRNTSNGATAGQIALYYRSGGSWNGLFHIARKGWLKISILLDFDGKSYDLYLQDLLMVRGATSDNGAASDVSRVTVLTPSGAPTIRVDNIRAEVDWSLPAESLLVADDFTVGTGEIEDSQPDSDGVNVNAQNWHVPVSSSKGSFTRTANGLQPDSGKSCSALYRTGGEGVWEATFTASAANQIHGGLIVRSWGGEDGGAAEVVLRYWSGSGSPIALFADGGSLAGSALSGTSITAGNDFTLKIEARGRYFWCYVNDVLQFGGPVLQGNAAQRGQMQEDHAGPYIAAELGTVGTDNYCKDFSYTGALTSSRKEKTIGDWTALIEPGTVRELYNAEVAAATTNLFWSRGPQFGHMAEHDMMPYAAMVRTLWESADLLVQQHRNLCLSEGEGAGYADCYVVFRRDCLWFSDRVYVGDASNYGYAPDLDLRESIWGRDFRYIGSTGASSSVSKTLSSSFVNRLTASPPAGHQALTDPASGDTLRLTHAVRGNANVSGSVLQLQDKLAGYGDPLTLQVGINASDLSVNTAYETGRWIYLERGSLSLSDSVLQGVRDDIKTAMTPTVATGSLKTDADGDLDTDGFNERFGWAEVDCDGSGHATFTIAGGTTARYRPAVRLHGFAAGGGVTGLTEGTDYLLDDMGDGNALLQILSVVNSDTEYEFTT